MDLWQKEIIEENMNSRFLKIKILFLISVIIMIGMSCKQKIDQNNLDQKIKEASAYCIKNGLNTDYAILIDMSIHSGKTRVFVYDFNSKAVVDSGLVTHGTCKHDYTTATPEFSNVPPMQASPLCRTARMQRISKSRDSSIRS